ncbi:unnamed protein product [Caenorhabditis bovis]|uniref:Uncharacterized protein n=1 Tax=Caenorhabditis bovis TaxID=2654633 RepID=A0A8S1ERX1_9PELO|nr:unnamed protein product [Caenorhabditis bovis]
MGQVPSNLPVTAWVTLHINKNHTIDYEFSEFVDCNYTAQTKFDMVATFDSNLKLVRGYVAKQPMEIGRVEAYVASPKTVIGPSRSAEYLCKVVPSENWPPIGTSVIIGAKRVDIEFYSIKSLTVNPSIKSLNSGPNGHLRTVIRKHPDFPGFYFSEALNLFVDDPINLLGEWLFSEYSNSTLAVTIACGNPTKNGKARYYISSIVDEKKLKKIENIRNCGKMMFTNELGVVVNANRKVLISKYPHLLVKIPTDLRSNEIKLGDVIKVDGKFDCETEKWVITDVQKVRPNEAFEYTFDHANAAITGPLFKISKLDECHEMPHMLRHSIFGVVHPPKRYIEFKLPLEKLRNVWIRAMPMSDALRSVCPFEAVFDEDIHKQVYFQETHKEEFVELDILRKSGHVQR